jgi:hypothetical protein
MTLLRCMLVPRAELDNHSKVRRPVLSVRLFTIHLQVQLFVRAYQVRGRYIAESDPLGIVDAYLADIHPPELGLS